MRRKKNGYFEREKEGIKPLINTIKKRVRFNEVDLMGIVWHGRYLLYFEEGFAELGRKCGLSYQAFLKSKIAAPIVQSHIDYYKSLKLDEEFFIKTYFLWGEAARLDVEFEILDNKNFVIASGYNIHMFINMETKDFCIIPPNILQDCRNKWKNGKFDHLL